MNPDVDSPETVGDPANTTVYGPLIPPTQFATQTGQAPTPSEFDGTQAEAMPTPPAPSSMPTFSDPSQTTARVDSVEATELDRNQTVFPQSGIPATAFHADTSDETRASHETPPITASSLDFSRHDGQGGYVPGEVVFGRYIAQKKLGEGGMGEVWLVTHRQLGVDRALKLIIKRVSYDHQARMRFRREAQILAKMNHPHAVTVHDASFTDDDVAYIEMEFVPGQSLDKIFHHGHPMPLARVARITDQLCSVLHTAHDLGIVHRDLKPANLMLLDGRPDGEEFLKVLDFGIAKVLEVKPTESELRTGTGMFVGTVAYASPEQLLGDAEARSDLYSVGVILFEFLTGRRPYLGNTNAILQQAITGNPPSFLEANPEIGQYDYPTGLEELVLRCLSKDVDQRPQSARELANLFREMVKVDIPQVLPTPVLPTPAPVRSVRKMAFAACVVVVAGIGGGLMVRKATGISVPSGFKAAPDAQPVAGGRPSVILPAKLSPKTDLRLIFLPGKTFLMGTGPLEHEEKVGDFYMSEAEISNRQMEAYFEANGISPPKSWEAALAKLQEFISKEEALDHPAAGIDHATAENFAQWLGAKLPTEAQWEFAATSRGVPGRTYPWIYPGESTEGVPRANINTLTKTEAATRKPKDYIDDRTEQGIVHLAGNVKEWCRDQAGVGKFAVRGGSFSTFPSEFPNQRGASQVATVTSDDLGFRIVVEDPAKK